MDSTHDGFCVPYAMDHCGWRVPWVTILGRSRLMRRQRPEWYICAAGGTYSGQVEIGIYTGTP